MDEVFVSETELNPLSEAERACEHFRLEVLPHLITPDFMQQLGQALTACEKRLKLTGNRELAEVAFVTRSLFEAAPSEILAFHPMIQTIGIETLRILVEAPDRVIDRREEVKEILQMFWNMKIQRYINGNQFPSFQTLNGIRNSTRKVRPNPT